MLKFCRSLAIVHSLGQEFTPKWWSQASSNTKRRY